MLEFVALGYALVKMDWNHLTGILRSLLWIFLHPITILKKRAQYRKLRKVSSKIIMANMAKTAIVLVHNLGGKKTYFEIESKAS